MKQNGNVLFLILIAVALFAALSYAVTQSTRSGGGSTKKESAVLAASQLLNYATAIENAIMRMRVSNGCSDTQISFQNPGWDSQTPYDNLLAPIDKRCHVFEPNGGGVSWRKPEASTHNTLGNGFSYYFNGANRVVNIGQTCADSTCNDLLMVHFDINEDVCREINDKLGVKNADGSIPEAGSWVTHTFKGDYTFNNNSIGNAGTGNGLQGTREACFKNLNSTVNFGDYIYYRVFIAR